MNEYGAERADAQHPWIGLASFTEGDRSFFAGRGDEIDDLLRLVRRDTLTLLYGVSGLGKTSLVQAGLFPVVREDNMLPVPIRLDYLEGALPLAHQIMNAIGAAARTARVEAPLPRPNETLWEYFHREENHFWSARNDLVTPFLAFDQFEEFFTLGRETPARAAQANAFIAEFADLIENRPPAALRDDPARAKEFNFKPVPVKVLLAMREDYLADLDRIRTHFRALGQNRLRLLPMGEKQARQVIALGQSLLAPGVEERIVHYVAGAGSSSGAEITVAPALLSLVLRELNERRLARGPDARITPDLLEVEQHKIFEDFYHRTLADFPPGMRLFIENELLTASGHRNSCALDDALTRPDVTLPALNELVNRRLLAYEDRHHTRRVELTHDVLVPVIKASRDSRLTRQALAQAERLRAEQVAQKRKQRLTLAVACGLAVALIATVWGGYYVFVKEHKAYYSDLIKRNGCPVGIRELSESEARKLAASYLVVYKGIVREGWRFRWKPPFRVVAVDSHLKPTTNHSMGTYLWKKSSDSDSGSGQSQARGERLGLHTVCQWEFVSNANGEVIYERALDREGRMVYGFIYSPPGSGQSGTRLARFVGPDGFPQLQRTSAAEYVSIHYDTAGWEDRVAFRDGKNMPAAGPDGAYGQSADHNFRGQVTRLLSLDADGNNMIDNTGNCGLEVIYDEKGSATEVRSLGPDLMPMAVKDGWFISKMENDDLGRLRRSTYHGAKGEPVVHKDGYHGWEGEYDEHGNQITTTYVGLDGKPTLLGSGAAIFRSAYNPEGKTTRMSYHGVNGEPVLHKDGNHAWEAKFDERGNQVSLTYVGLDGKPTLVTSGYAAMRSTFDARGRKTRQAYFGTNGEPVLHKDGNHAWESEYDDRGNEISTTFAGLDGKPASLVAGYAIIRKRYDSDGNELDHAYFSPNGKPVLEKESGIHKAANSYDGRGKVIRRRFLGVKDEPVLHKDGNHGWDAEYDERGNEVLDTYVGLDEKPILLANGFATIKSAYDAGGKQTRMSLHGVNGEPVLHKEGHHGWEARFDERGRRIEKTFFGVNEEPLLLPDGYATVRWAHDARGNETRATYYGPDGQPTLYQKSYHGWEAQFDDHGNEIVRTFIGLDGKPVPQETGVAIIKAAYEVHGRMTKMTFYGVNDEPVLHKNGHHGWETEYDARGNELSTTYLGLDGKPALLPGGFAIVKAEFDPRGNAIRQTYHGVNGEPVLHRDGYHGWQATYDERGKPSAKTYFDLDGNPVELKKSGQR